jgi:ribosome-associated protein
MKFKSPILDISYESINRAVLSDVIVYDVSTVTPFFDYSIVCTASSSRQGMSAVGYLRDEAQKQGYIVKGYSMSNDSKWFFVDLNSVIVHIFVGEDRVRYNLDGLYYHLDKENLE